MQTAIQFAAEPVAVMIGLMSLALITLCISFAIISKDDCKDSKKKK